MLDFQTFSRKQDCHQSPRNREFQKACVSLFQISLRCLVASSAILFRSAALVSRSAWREVVQPNIAIGCGVVAPDPADVAAPAFPKPCAVQ